MKNTNKLLFLGLFLFGITATSAQISTSTGGAANVLPNVPTTNTNVGIGTTNPTAKLEVIGNVKASTGVFTKSAPNGSVFTSNEDRNYKSLSLSVGSLLPGYLTGNEVRMLRFYDFPQSNLNPKSTFWFSIEDRADAARFRVIAETGGGTQMQILNKTQQVLFRVNEDGSDNVYMDMPNPNSRIVIGSWGDYLPEHKFVVRGSAKIEGNIITDSNIGVGTNNPIGKFDVRGNVFIGTSDLSIGSVGSFVQIDQGLPSGNSYSQIRAFSNGGNINNHLVLQSTGGNVGIGSVAPDQKLTVKGKIHAEEIIVDLNVPADYVFQKYYTGKSELKSDYAMPTLAEIESFTKKNNHLPNVPSAKDIQQNGVSLGEMSNVLLQKVEELTLYAIEQDKKAALQQKELERLKKENENYKSLAERLSSIEKALNK